MFANPIGIKEKETDVKCTKPEMYFIKAIDIEEENDMLMPSGIQFHHIRRTAGYNPH